MRRRPPRDRSKTASARRVEALIEEATVDCHDESEQLTGLYTMLEEHLETPFRTQVLGVDVIVQRVDLTENGEVVGVCVRGHSRQAVSILELPLPTPKPRGSEWIEAYRRWARGR